MVSTLSSMSAAQIFEEAITKRDGSQSHAGAGGGAIEGAARGALFDGSSYTKGDQPSLFGVVACCQIHWLVLAADKQDLGAVGLKDNLGVFIQVYTCLRAV